MGTRLANRAGGKAGNNVAPQDLDLVSIGCGIVARLGTAQVIHSLAASNEDHQMGFLIPDSLDDEAWPGIARLLLGLGCAWPAVVDLAAMTTVSQPAIADAVARAEQTGRELADLPVPDFWQVACGLIARSWRLGLYDSIDAMYQLEGLWWLIRDRPRSGSRGLQIIWEGMGLKELLAFYGISGEAVPLLVKADQFIPAGAVDGPLCTAIRHAIY